MEHLMMLSRFLKIAVLAFALPITSAAFAAEDLDEHRKALLRIMGQVPGSTPASMEKPIETDVDLTPLEEEAEPAAPIPVASVDLDTDLNNVAINVPDLHYPSYLKTKQLKKLKKYPDKRLAIPVYRVAFTVQTAASAHSMAALDRDYGGVSTSMTVSLAGVSSDTMQAITDRAWRDFQQRLVDEGFELVPMEEIEQTEGYGKIKFTRGLYSKNILGTAYAVYSPSTMPLFWDFGHPIGNAGFSIGTEFNEISRDTNALLVIPTLVVNFVEMESSGRSMVARSASVNAEMGMSLLDMSQVHLRIGHPKMATAVDFLGGMSLKDNLNVAGDYGTLVKGSNNYNDQALMGLMSQGMGTALSSTVRESRIVQADPMKYSEVALQALGSGNAMFAAALKDAQDGVKPPKKKRK